MPKSCVANFDNVTLVDVNALAGLVTVLDPAVMARVCAALNAAMGCDRPYVRASSTREERSI